jgi:hypothetical protein
MLSRFQWTVAFVEMPLSDRSPDGVPTVVAMQRRPAGPLCPLRCESILSTPQLTELQVGEGRY